MAAFGARHVRHRPFFAPVTLHPRLARALVNCAGVGAGALVWDPFCGTGGILLEAGLVGARVAGSDLQSKMVEGTRTTLAAMDVRPERLEAGDVAAAAASIGRVDAVVTDPPYGRGATTNRERPDALYRRFFDAAADALAPGGALVAILPSKEAAALAQGFRLEEMHEVPVHRSLTRHVCRFVRL